MLFKQIDKDFGQYIDALSRTKPKAFHHVYEWGKAGKPAARLFKLRTIEYTLYIQMYLQTNFKILEK